MRFIEVTESFWSLEAIKYCLHSLLNEKLNCSYRLVKIKL